MGLSTALANAKDLADWLGCGKRGEGCFNFRPSVRPVPLEVHISGFPGKHYCPRMATMNRPIMATILTYSPRKPVLVFVVSTPDAAHGNGSHILLRRKGKPKDVSSYGRGRSGPCASRCRDKALRHCLSFGIGLHHGGLVGSDRDIVEAAFLSGGLQILVCTSTLAWGLTFPPIW